MDDEYGDSAMGADIRRSLLGNALVVFLVYE
jgi:hypothetical protein